MSSASIMTRKLSGPRPDAQEVSMPLTSSNSQRFFGRIKSRKHSGAQCPLSPAEAVWYLSLPEKVRRQQFTREEQILMRARAELALLDTAPKAVNHADDITTRSPHPSRAQSCRHDSTASSTKTPLLKTSAYHDSVPSSPSLFSETDTPRLVDEGFDESPFNPRSSFFHSPSFRNSSWPRSIESAPASPLVDKRMTLGAPPSRSRAQPPPALPLNKTLYLNDPSAKEILRDCLDSSRFEECLTFGFPTNGSPRQAEYDMISPSSQAHSNWLASPVREASDMDDDWMDSSSVDERELCTPTSPIHPQFFIRHSAPYDDDMEYEAAEAPTIPRNASNSSYFEELMRRDMTLRMTLTKPELRASDEELYGWQQGYSEPASPNVFYQKDPLALEDLTFSDDTTGRSGVFAQEMTKKKGLRGLWSRK